MSQLKKIGDNKYELKVDDFVCSGWLDANFEELDDLLNDYDFSKDKITSLFRKGNHTYQILLEPYEVDADDTWSIIGSIRKYVDDEYTEKGLLSFNLESGHATTDTNNITFMLIDALKNI